MLANVRTPEERAGDLDAQRAALHTGATRLLEMVARRGEEAVLGAMDELVAYADRVLSRGIQLVPDGRF
jgi:N-methylhydantoinase B